jgi:hypothetical protein
MLDIAWAVPQDILVAQFAADQGGNSGNLMAIIGRDGPPAPGLPPLARKIRP